MKTIDSLKELYAAMGGDPQEVENLTLTADIISAVAKVAGSLGGTLPEVTLEDNGDVLGVVDGQWAKTSSGLPAVTADDNGKYLKVVNGVWTAAEF